MRRIRYLRLTGRQRRWVWLWLTVLLVTGLCCAAVLHMRPIIVSLATARVSNAVNRIVVDAVRDAIDSGQVNYDVLIHLEKDESGRVAALESNMAAFNRLRSQIADYVVVMYAGRVVEKGTAQEIFANPAHPYTIGLMASKPMVGKKVDKLYSIPGKVPNPINMPNYCYFKDRCEMCVDGCQGEYPHMIQLSPTHMVSCYRYYGKEDAQNG